MSTYILPQLQTEQTYWMRDEIGSVCVCVCVWEHQMEQLNSIAANRYYYCLGLVVLVVVVAVVVVAVATNWLVSQNYYNIYIKYILKMKKEE